MSLNLFSLDGRIALVTGSAQGIGLALAEGLGRAGARIVLNGRDDGKLQAAAARLRADGIVVDTMASTSPIRQRSKPGSSKSSARSGRWISSSTMPASSAARHSRAMPPKPGTS